ncbi:MAG: DoxX family protein [Pseudomonadales bacterium]
MSIAISATTLQDRFIDALRPADGIAPLLLRLYLAPVMVQAGWTKFMAFDDTAAWLGNPDWGLGLPLPELLAFLAAGTELVGGIALLVGLATRWFAIPLIFTMLVAIFAVHWENGWLALSDSSSWLANERVMEAAPRKEAAIAILKEHGDYGWLTARGPITILNNGIEFAATYLIMLISLLFTGGGRYTSADFWIARAVAPGRLDAAHVRSGCNETSSHASIAATNH